MKFYCGWLAIPCLAELHFLYVPKNYKMRRTTQNIFYEKNIFNKNRFSKKLVTQILRELKTTHFSHKAPQQGLAMQGPGSNSPDDKLYQTHFQGDGPEAPGIRNPPCPDCEDTGRSPGCSLASGSLVTLGVFFFFFLKENIKGFQFTSFYT